MEENLFQPRRIEGREIEFEKLRQEFRDKFAKDSSFEYKIIIQKGYLIVEKYVFHIDIFECIDEFIEGGILVEDITVYPE